MSEEFKTVFDIAKLMTQKLYATVCGSRDHPMRSAALQNKFSVYDPSLKRACNPFDPLPLDRETHFTRRASVGDLIEVTVVLGPSSQGVQKISSGFRIYGKMKDERIFSEFPHLKHTNDKGYNAVLIQPPELGAMLNDLSRKNGNLPKDWLKDFVSEEKQAEGGIITLVTTGFDLILSGAFEAASRVTRVVLGMELDKRGENIALVAPKNQ